jgi:hypothetical protein
MTTTVSPTKWKAEDYSSDNEESDETLISKEEDLSTILPLVIAPQDNEIFKLTDQFTRFISGRPEKGQGLAALHELVQLVALS